ncbi:hypothetical protein [Providencia sneebia]|uniref:Fimbrial protein n=1 Tax=Providencia sneebia DSM 19967 TaxID=1141660 RepID=K8WBM3_9GAMM|nr:hypothetical protein [Providencia sneebia]EKT57306.1 hypothetical protein OO7_07955 [Providencia sneebia DSM 19967]
MRLNLFILFLVSSPLYADIYLSETRVYNLVTGEARLVSGINVDGDSAGFIVQDANQEWLGTGPDGKTYRVFTLKYSFSGQITLTVDESFYSNIGNCEFNGEGDQKQLYVGWTVMQPGISGTIYSSAGALYSSGFSQGVGVQSRWRGIPVGQPTFTATFNNSSQSADVYITNGPQGIYTMPGGKMVYVHTDGERPNALPYADIYGLSCGAVLGVGESIPTEPIEPPAPDIVCDFSTGGDIDLGVVDITSASNRYASTYLYTQCTDDATVTATIQKSGGGNNLLQMGGLNLRVIFDNSSDKKTYSANTSQNSQIIWGQVTSVGTLTPGDYSQSMVVYLNYE